MSPGRLVAPNGGQQRPSAAELTGIMTSCRPAAAERPHPRANSFNAAGPCHHRHGPCSGGAVTQANFAQELNRPLGLCSVASSALVGLRPEPIEVQVTCSRGPAFFQLVGLAQTPVREARVRVGSALARLGVLLEEWAITVNLAPANLRKTEAALDLAIALGILSAIGRISGERLKNTLILGELSLDGALRPIRGVLPLLVGARDRGLECALLPQANAREAGLVGGLEKLGADNLEQITNWLSRDATLARIPQTQYTPAPIRQNAELAEVRGQVVARRALELAAAGGHNLLMVGPPGAGKTMLARRLPGILPELQYEEALECTAVHSVAGLIDPSEGVIAARPFRAPHHTVTQQALVGGGEFPRPGELSLAHNGVLFLDELPEFNRRSLESLRQPLEDGRVTISRTRGHAEFPTRPIVVGAMNPCPCGYYGHPARPCSCSAKQRQRYRSRISGPLLDRFDVHTVLPPVSLSALTSSAPRESSDVVRNRVSQARQLQLERYRDGVSAGRTNAELGPAALEGILKPTQAALRLLQRATTQFGLSARAHTKVLHVARTAADLERAGRIGEEHMAEALQGRLMQLGDG